jgi:hypothetical protein
MLVEITKTVKERKRLYASTIVFRESRLFFDNESAARHFPRWLKEHGFLPDPLGVDPPITDEIMNLDVQEVPE